MPGAARLGDEHTCPHPGAGPLAVTTCGRVLVNTRPAVRLSDQAICPMGPDPVAMGDFTVLVQGLPCARKGDPTAHGGSILTGSEDVIVSAGAGSAAGSAAAALAWSAQRCAALWAQLIEQIPNLPEIWQQACAADDRARSAEPRPEPSEDFACFVMSWAQADPRTRVEQARGLFRAFACRYRALDALLPNGLPPPESLDSPAPELTEQRDTNDDSEEDGSR